MVGPTFLNDMCGILLHFRSHSSPFMLNAALHYHLRKFSMPIAADIETNLYVDNVISGCESEADAVNYYNTSRSIMGQAKFNLQTWASNSVEVQSQAQTHNVAERDETTKVLGLLWHTDSDTLSCLQDHNWRSSSY